LSAARFAYGMSRVRARKSRLPGAREAGAAWRPAAEGEDRATRFAALVADYAMVLHSFPRGQGLVRALLGLHEVENLKLGWRALSAGLPAARWAHLWRELGPLQTLRLDRWRDAVSLPDAIAAAGPPLRAVAEEVYRLHGPRVAAAEPALDRRASRRILDESRALPEAERTARELARSLVRERDLDVLRRGGAFGMAPETAAGLTVLLPEEAGAEALRALAGWTPAQGPLAAHLPRELRRAAEGAAGWDGLFAALRRARRRACVRAFREAPFQLGCAVAFLLLREEEERSWTALAEAGTRAAASRALERVLAAGPMAAV
jgi:hypothetical protein